MKVTNLELGLVIAFFVGSCGPATIATPITDAPTPLKKISDDEQKPFIKLVDRILAAKRANPEAETSKWEGEIDELVYTLYGLTEAEIKVVEGVS